MNDLKFSPITQRILARAGIEADGAGKDSVEPIHLLTAILQEGRSAAGIVLAEKGITEQMLRDADFKK